MDGTKADEAVDLYCRADGLMNDLTDEHLTLCVLVGDRRVSDAYMQCKKVEEMAEQLRETLGALCQKQSA